MSKVVFMIGSLRGGGAEKVCVTIANELTRSGTCVEIVVLNTRNAVYVDDLSDEVNFVNLNVRNTRTSIWKLAIYLLKEKPNVILSFNRQISIVLVILRWLLKLEFRLVSRNIIFISIAEREKRGFWHGYIVGLLVKKLYPKSDHFVAQSHAMKLDMISYLNVPSENISVIHNPINHAIIECRGGFKNRYLTSRCRRYVLFVGRLEPQKGVEYSIIAFSNVASIHNDIRLKILGKGSLENQLKSLVRDLGLEDRVDFEGFVSDVIPYYQAARCTMLTSLFEGFPNVLIESIALGTPVVAFDCPSGPNEIIVEGANGYLVQRENQSDLNKLLALALEKAWDPEEVSRTADKFDLNEIADQYRGVLLNC